MTDGRKTYSSGIRILIDKKTYYEEFCPRALIREQEDVIMKSLLYLGLKDTFRIKHAAYMRADSRAVKKRLSR